MRHLRFEYKEDEEFGTMGWALPIAGFNVGDGRIVAHDVMEHGAGESGTVVEELRALGAMVLIRGLGGYFDSLHRNDPAFHASADVTRMLRDVYEERDYIPHCIREQSKRAISDGTYAQDIIDRTINLARRDLVDEIGEHPAPLWMTQHLNACRQLMMEGYRNAKRRYRGHDCWSLCCTFNDIQRQVDKVHGDVGMVLDVYLSNSSLRVKIDADNPRDENW